MTLTQLKYLVAIQENGYSIINASKNIYTSQPGMSKRIRELEDQLGFDLLVRKGKRITGLTPQGHEVMAIAKKVIKLTEKIKELKKSD